MADLLVVDDDADAAGALAEVLRMEGHDVRVAYNGHDGLSRTNQRKPDLVLLDVEMPLLGGLGMAYEMFLHDLGMEMIPIVLISGVVDLPEVAQRVGTPYFVQKPYKLEKLIAAVTRALKERVPPSPAPPDAAA